MIGTTVGKYRIVARLGRGGMGTVYKAMDETLDREVAIKVLNAEVSDTRLMARFKAEATTLARLNHPGIATIYEVHKTEDDLFMVMELVRGETLDQMLVRTGPLAPDRAARIVAHMLGALGYAHRAGIIHRDLKPANVMLTDAGAVKIMDFGIARVVGAEHLTSDGTTMGTPAYMAPEQVVGKEIDPRADLYSAGVVFYRLLTGCLPFSADTPFAMVQKQLWDVPTPAREHRTDLPEWAEHILDRALAKSPSDRFQSAEEFRTALLSPLGGSANAFTVDLSTLTDPGDWPPSPVPPLPIETTHGSSDAALTLAPTIGAGPSRPVMESASGIPLDPTVAARPAATPEPTPEPTRSRLTPTTLAMAGAAVMVVVLALVAVTRDGSQPDAGTATTASVTAPEPTGQASGAPVAAAAPTLGAADSTTIAGAATTPGGATTGAVATAGAATAAAPARVAAKTTPAPTPPAVEPAAAPAAASTAAAEPEPPAPAPEAAAPVLPPFRFGAQAVVADGGKHRQRETTVELADGAASVVGKDSTFSTVVPLAAVVGFSYSNSKQPLWNSPQGPAEIAHLDGGAFGFLRGDQHWVSLRTDSMSLVLRVREQDARKVITALEERIGRKVDRVERR